MLEFVAVIFALGSLAARITCGACLVGAIIAGLGANLGISAGALLGYMLGAIGVWAVCSILAYSFAEAAKWG